MQHNGFALRIYTFEENGRKRNMLSKHCDGLGRAWAFPRGNRVVLTNIYGLHTREYRELATQVVGLLYPGFDVRMRAVDLYIVGCSTMWLNGDSFCIAVGNEKHPTAIHANYRITWRRDYDRDGSLPKERWEWW